MFGVYVIGKPPIWTEFCCENPEPAFLVRGGNAEEGGKRSQVIECVRCRAKLVELSWEVR